jgi:hypothetical protein
MSDEPCPYVTGTVTQHCTLTPFTLTDAEREAIAAAVAYMRPVGNYDCVTFSTLRGLLERTKG